MLVLVSVIATILFWQPSVGSAQTAPPDLGMEFTFQATGDPNHSIGDLTLGSISILLDGVQCRTVDTSSASGSIGPIVVGDSTAIDACRRAGAPITFLRADGKELFERTTFAPRSRFVLQNYAPGPATTGGTGTTPPMPPATTRDMTTDDVAGIYVAVVSPQAGAALGYHISGVRQAGRMPDPTTDLAALYLLVVSGGRQVQEGISIEALMPRAGRPYWRVQDRNGSWDALAAR